jgi:hypothetical protein
MLGWPLDAVIALVHCASFSAARRTSRKMREDLSGRGVQEIPVERLFLATIVDVGTYLIQVVDGLLRLARGFE